MIYDLLWYKASQIRVPSQLDDKRLLCFALLYGGRKNGQDAKAVLIWKKGRVPEMECHIGSDGFVRIGTEDEKQNDVTRHDWP